MSNSPMGDFTKLVPGFDFLQGLAKTAGSAMPSIGQWVAPTLDPAEIEKRIEELKTVQFWLEQNARMLGATIQAMEVQRMTLTTLKTMNVQMTDLQEAMKIRLPERPAAAAPTPAVQPPAPPPEPTPEAPAPAAAESAGASPMVDPMQWWGALTKQFSELAASALKDNPAAAAASQMVKQSIDATGETLQKAAHLPAAVAGDASARSAAPARKAAAKGAAGPAAKSAAKSARKPGGGR